MTGSDSAPVVRKIDPRWVVAALIAIIAPVLFMLARAFAASRNVPYMDDIDGAMMLLVRLSDGASWTELVNWLAELSNEHRMVTSRLLHVLSYSLTGTINFAVFGVIANLFLCV